MSALTHPTHLPMPHGIRPSVARDLAIVAAITVLTFTMSAVFELNERLVSAVQPFERYQVDEVPITLLVMAIAMAWFSWRRFRHARDELNLRLAAQQALALALEENRMLSQRSMQVQEEERRNLARELHDELGQSINAIKVDAVNIRDHSQAQPDIHTSAVAIIDVSNQVYDVVRSLMQRLRPVALDDLGLRSAVQYGVEQWQRRHAGVRCQFDAQGELDGLSEKVNITLYRLVQECLTNVAKHADAGHVSIAMKRDGDRVRFDFVDDGRGFDPSGRKHGLGLIGLRERVESLGGKFELVSAPGSGVRIKAVIPAGEESK
jgi:two-component system sensor histidine kinase UhpB